MASQDLLLNAQTRKQVAWASSIALVGSTYFALMIFALQFLRPDLDPIRQPASRYAIGPYGFLMTTAFFMMSVASWSLVVALSRGMAQPVRSRMGFALFALWGFGVLVAMIFPMDVERTQRTLAGIIHDVSGPLAFLWMSAGVLLISRRFRQDEKWSPFYGPALVLSLLLWAGYIGTFLSFVFQLDFLGAVQRLTLAVLVIWMVLTASRLLGMKATIARQSHHAGSSP